MLVVVVVLLLFFGELWGLFRWFVVVVVVLVFDFAPELEACGEMEQKEPSLWG